MHDVDRSGPVGPQKITEQPVWLGLDADEMENATAGPVSPDVNSDEQREPVDLVGPQIRAEQPVLLGLDADQMKHVPAGPVDPDNKMYRPQPVADSPVGQSNAHRQVGTEETLILTDSDRPVADGPVGLSFRLGPVGHSRMSSLDEVIQPVAVCPVGHPIATGPVGNHARKSDNKRRDQVEDGPVDSNGIQHPQNRTGSRTETDVSKLGTVSEPASSDDISPSSDSGVHSLGEQWENMSAYSMNEESEQNEIPNYESSVVGRVRDTRTPPNTEEDEDIDYPWADRLLAKKPDGSSPNKMMVHAQRSFCS